MNATGIMHYALTIGFCSLVLSLPCRAADLGGVWASDARVCNKMYEKTAKGIAFKKDADLYGNGFIIDGGKIRGRTAACDIKSTKEEKGMVHMIAACATDIMMGTVQFSIKVIDANKVARVFPSMPDLEMYYDRCSL